MILGSDFPGPGSRTWRPSPVLIALGVVAACAAVVWVVFTSNPMDLVVGVVIAVVLAVASVTGSRRRGLPAAALRARRLTAGPRGLLVTRFGGQRLVPWSQVHAIRSATSSRLGLANTTLEIDLVDEDLLVFGRTDLGADPTEVLAALREWSPKA